MPTTSFEYNVGHECPGRWQHDGSAIDGSSKVRINRPRVPVDYAARPKVLSGSPDISSSQVAICRDGKCHRVRLQALFCIE